MRSSGSNEGRTSRLLISSSENLKSLCVSDYVRFDESLGKRTTRPTPTDPMPLLAPTGNPFPPMPWLPAPPRVDILPPGSAWSSGSPRKGKGRKAARASKPKPAGPAPDPYHSAPKSQVQKSRLSTDVQVVGDARRDPTAHHPAGLCGANGGRPMCLTH